MTVQNMQSQGGVPVTVVHRWEAPWGGVVAASHIGLGRTNQEDRISVSSDVLTLAVADGMGGHGNGEKAAQSAVDAATTTGLTSPEEAVRGGLLAAHRCANDVPYERGDDSKPGTTLVVARIAPGDRAAWVGWAGDTRAYHYQHPGKLAAITTDHSFYRNGPLSHCIIAGEREDAHRMDGAVRRQFASGDILMLCTDGLSGLRRMSEGRNNRLIAKAMEDNYGSRDAMARALVQLALDSGGHDNVTVALVRFL